MLKRTLLVTCLLSLLTFTLTACGPGPSPEASPTVLPPALLTTPLPATSLVNVTPQAPSTVFASPTMTQQSNIAPPPDSSEEKDLVDFILRRLAVRGDQAHFIAQVAPVDENAGHPVDVARVLFLHCWVYQQKQFNSCDRNAFLKNLNQDKQNPPWRYSYTIFYISHVDDIYTTATVRLDHFAGPKASSGTLITLKKTNGQWEVESQKSIWVS